jgi:hypothetical protein
MDVDTGRLRHWSRVAFAARCARRVQPLFREAWPDAIERRKAAIEEAITLAEQSAAEGRPLEGLNEAVLAALMAAGRAQIPHLYPVPIEDAEPIPVDLDSATVAALAAKVAEKTAQAAKSSPQESADLANEAFSFAVDAIRASGRLSILKFLEADFAALAKREVKKPWWRCW